MKAPSFAASCICSMVILPDRSAACVAIRSFTPAALASLNASSASSGHVVPEDALLAFREARAAGVKLLIATHAADLSGKMTIEQMQEAAKLGAFIEFDYRNTLDGGRTAVSYTHLRAHETRHDLVC